MPFKFYVSVITVLLCSAAHGQRVSLAQGATFTYSFAFHYTKGQEALSTKSDTYRFEVLRKDDNGFYRVRCTLVDFSKDESYNTSEMLASTALFQHPFELVVDSNGYLIRTEGIKEIVVQKTREWELKSPITQLLLRSAGHNLAWQIREIFPVLPLTDEGWQKDWKSAVSSREYRVTGNESDLIQINYNETNDDGDSVYKSVTEMNGQLLFSRSTGKVVSGVQESIHSGERAGTSPNSTIPYRVEQELIVTLVPDTFRIDAGQAALATVMIKMSNWSAAIRNGTAYDSAKVYAFFKANDGAWGANKDYALSKLDILQSIGYSNHYDAYHIALLHTPNAWLKDNDSHLYNKLEEAAKNNADSAYAIMRWFNKSPRYSEWLQQSLAKVFIETGTGNEKRVAIGRALLEKLILDPDTTISNAAYPLRLWTEVRYHPSDTILRRDNIALLEQLSPSKAKEGNAQRYALLLYRQLCASDRKEMAARLIIHIIPRLEAEANDSSNRNRYAARYLLAYAWQLKYQEAKTGDPVIALGYLAKASALSPKDSFHLSDASFTDILFLGSKESYKADFADALLEAGDKKQVLKLAAEQMKADPLLTEELKKAYERRYPGRDFNKFLEKLPQNNRVKQ